MLKGLKQQPEAGQEAVQSGQGERAEQQQPAQQLVVQQQQQQQAADHLLQQGLGSKVDGVGAGLENSLGFQDAALLMPTEYLEVSLHD